MPDEQDERDVHQPSCSTIVPAKRKRVSRSPYQRNKPVIAKSTANAAVMIAFSFWPALRRPCGVRLTAKPRAVVRVEARRSRCSAAQPAPVAEEHDDQQRDSQAMAV